MCDAGVDPGPRVGQAGAVRSVKSARHVQASLALCIPRPLSANLLSYITRIFIETAMVATQVRLEGRGVLRWARGKGWQQQQQCPLPGAAAALMGCMPALISLREPEQASYS